MTKRASEMTTEELAQYVMENSTTGDPDLSLGDWLDASQVDGLTADEVVREWDEGRD